MSYPKSLAYAMGLVLYLINSNIWAQNAPNTEKVANPGVQVKARVQKGRVLLRWAVDQPTAWKAANKQGFIVERYNWYYGKDSQRLLAKQLLTRNPIKAQPLEKWRTAIEKDDNAAIIAQSLYGETFSFNTNNNTQSQDKFANILSNTDEVTLRYSFALLAADLNFDAACMAGWGFIDSTASINEEYYYRVYIADNNKKTKIDTGVTIANTREYRPVTAPLMFKGQGGNKTATLTWDNQWQASAFTSYILERSEDNNHFKAVTDKPIININSAEEQLPNFVFNDTLPENDKVYYYRLKGITAFSEISEPTEAIKITGKAQLAYAPNIVETNILNDSSVVIKWHMPHDSTLNLLTTFELSQSDAADGHYTVVVKNINKTARSLTFTGLLPTNYFIISAIDKNGQKYASFPQLIQTVDATPPAPPMAIEGFIDSNGVVKLTWKANIERDLLGYHVFKANVKDEEMSLVTTDPLSINAFSDSISSQLTNDKVYYALVAVDQRYNQSKMSEIVEITRPDKTPPVAPVFKDYKLEENKVFLSWESSASEDIAQQRLYKKTIINGDNSDEWVLLKEFNTKDSTTFTDTLVTAGTTIGYTLMAVDKTKNESTPSVPLTVNIPLDKRNKAAVGDLKAVADRKSKKILVEWAYKEKGVAEYQIYKTFGKEPLTLWKVAENTTVAIVDDDISPSNLYKYAVRAVFRDGTMSQIKEVAIEY